MQNSEPGLPKFIRSILLYVTAFVQPIRCGSLEDNCAKDPISFPEFTGPRVMILVAGEPCFWNHIGRCQYSHWKDLAGEGAPTKKT